MSLLTSVNQPLNSFSCSATSSDSSERSVVRDGNHKSLAGGIESEGYDGGIDILINRD